MLYLEKHELLCLYSSLDIANHTGGAQTQRASSRLHLAGDLQAGKAVIVRTTPVYCCINGVFPQTISHVCDEYHSED